MKRVVLLAILISFTGLMSCAKEALEAPAPKIDENLVTEEALAARTQEVVNDFRISRNLTALETSKEAYDLALEHSQYMASKGTMSHANFDQRAEQLNARVKVIRVAENVAVDYQTAEDALKGWLGSTPHRETILGDFTHAAVAVVSTPEGRIFYTQLFYKKASD